MRYKLLAGMIGLLLVVVSVEGCSDKDEQQKEKTPDRKESAPPTGTVPPAAVTAPGKLRGLSAPPAGTTEIDAVHLRRAQKLINDGVRFLLDQRETDGGWSLGRGAHKPAVTAMVLKVLVQHPDFDTQSPEVKRGIEVLLRYRQSDGGVYDPKQGAGNYTTAIAVMAMVVVQDPQLNDEIREGVGFLKRLQIVPGSESPDGEKITDEHPFVGGVSYGEHGRPDLSNVGMWMQALHDAGVSSDDPAIQRALIFVSRTQNRSESNPLIWATEGNNDGGFIYAPAIKGDVTKGESKGGVGGGGRGLRSYGSMTYVGFKSMLYAGLSKDDPRVRAAYEWIRKYWRLDSNPNMPKLQSHQGLYYYYHVFAKALRAWGEPIVVDVKGTKHNWREELIDALADRVRPDGSWVNEADRWAEGYPVLATAYSVLGLQESLKK